jgi:hypothetical protein
MRVPNKLYGIAYQRWYYQVSRGSADSSDWLLASLWQYEGAECKWTCLAYARGQWKQKMHSVKSSNPSLICDDEENDRHCGRSGTILQQDAVRQTHKLLTAYDHEVSLKAKSFRSQSSVFKHIKTRTLVLSVERCSVRERLTEIHNSWQRFIPDGKLCNRSQSHKQGNRRLCPQIYCQKASSIIIAERWKMRIESSEMNTGTVSLGIRS